LLSDFDKIQEEEKKKDLKKKNCFLFSKSPQYKESVGKALEK
jgi:hypothetical protein